jgi:hypothetical protein
VKRQGALAAVGEEAIYSQDDPEKHHFPKVGVRKKL